MRWLIWLDLAVVYLILRGAIDGYLGGWRPALCRLGGLACATLAALAGQGGIRQFSARHGVLEKVVEAAIHSRLALPVSGFVYGKAAPPDLPAVLWQVLQQGAAPAAGAGPGNLSELLVQLLVYTVAFLTGLLLWWGLFYLCGEALAGQKSREISKIARWGGALIGAFRQFCHAAIIIGVALPLAWLGGAPPGLLQLEESPLAGLAWAVFAALGIWR